MDYRTRLQKFITSQHLNTGIRVTGATLIPALLLYQFNFLTEAIGVCFGALFTGLIDNPGPFHHRRNGILLSIPINFLVIMIVGLSHGIPWLIAVELVAFSVFFSMVSVYGSRAGSIGAIALIIFILHLNPLRAPGTTIYEDAAYVALGGLWYFLLALTGYSIRPYKQVQLLLGDYLMDISAYLHTKSKFYLKKSDYTPYYKKLIDHQIKINQHQNELREVLFKTRSFLTESTRKGRSLMMMFLDSIDLLERIMTSQQDYAALHKQFDDTDILTHINNNLVILANTIHNIGLAVQGGYSYKSNENLGNISEEVMQVFLKIRKENLTSESLESFISLRHILYSLQDITERIKRLETYAAYNADINKDELKRRQLHKFVSSQKFDIDLLLNNLSLQSTTFRHSLRLTVALLAGYLISLLFTSIGHSYWILLSIATILRPAFGATKKRNIERVSGTIAGAALGFVILFLSADNNLAILIAMVVAMLLAYSFLKLQYFVSVTAVTVYVIMSLHFLNPGTLKSSLNDRVIDTLIASLIAWLVSGFVLQSWEYKTIGNQIKKAMEANRNYFLKSAAIFTGDAIDAVAFKIARKDAFVALANLADSFQKMLAEPKEKQPKMEYYHQLVTAIHVATSHIAALSYYAQSFGAKYVNPDFAPLIKQVDRQMDRAVCIVENEYCTGDELANKLPTMRKVQQLLDQRKKDLEAGIDSDMETIKKVLSDLKTITDQFQLISATTVDTIKILQKIYPGNAAPAATNTSPALAY